ncbi:MAG: glycosyltransferase family 2 protein [Patescibacteria group bacterium]
MKISIIIISWQVKELLRKCLESIYKNQGGLSLEIFVVDNASADGSVEMIKNEFSWVRPMSNEKNLGFARANNQAIKLATGDYILLLNPDTELLPGALGGCLEFMASSKDCGIMGGQILNPDGTIQPSVRKFPTFWPIFLLFLKIPKIFKNIKSIDNYLAVDFDYSQAQEVDQVMGAFMFIRKEVFAKIGQLDDDFFLWFEEVDFCRRCWRAGFKILYNPRVKIIHYGGQSFNQQKIISRQFLFFKSAWHYFRKNGFIDRDGDKIILPPSLKQKK